MLLILDCIGCAQTAKIVSREFSAGQMIHHSQFKKLDENANINEYAIFFDKGDTLPLEISIDTESIGAVPENIALTARKKIYFHLKMPENFSKKDLALLEKTANQKMDKREQSELLKHFMMYISTDGKNWAPINDMPSVKEVLGMKQGTLSFGMTMDQKKGITAFLNMEEMKPSGK